MKSKKQTILEWYRENGEKIDAPCGGRGTCGKCKVCFKKQTKEATKREKELLTAEEIENNIRLACMTEMTNEEPFELVGELFVSQTKESKKEVSRKHVRKEEKDSKYGVAIDIGTTTLVMQLIDLLNGSELVTLAEINPQRMYGADVMTRIRCANEGKEKELQRLVKDALKEMFERLLRQAEIRRELVKKVVIVGNTTMLHLLLGYSCSGLGVAPFEPVNLQLHRWDGTMCEGGLSKEAEVIVFPGISTFVGADIVAGIYACEMDLKEEVQMLVDVGTNGEMVLGNKDELFVTSTAAGPVFEGGNISCGMPAVKGCITHLSVGQEQWSYEALGERLPTGLCGSALIDLLAGMYKIGIIDENGTLLDKYFEEGYCINEQFNIRILQSDIRELQMGKAAIRAGMELLEKRNKPVKIYLAGAFGTEIRLDSATLIGLFSKEAATHMQIMSNTALKGAKKFLIDTAGEDRLRHIVAKAKEVVLAKEADFEELYISYMQF